MADTNITIFRNLRNFSTTPPPDSFKEIWAALENDRVEKQVFAAINSDTLEEGSKFSDNETKVFRSLQDFTIAPPDFSALKIHDNISIPTQKNLSKSPGRVIDFKFFTKIAAAILIVGCTAYAIYFASRKGKEPASTIAVSNETINSTVSNNSAGIASSLSTISKNNGNIPSANTKAVAAIGFHTARNNKSKVRTSGKVDSYAANFKYSSSKTKFVDNDILLTLVSYKYHDYSKLLSEIKKNKKITLDMFSYVSVSDKMNDVLKKMYSTKKNNKPTRKAKKLKSKLEKWKKSDEKYFDSNLQNNPIDIIDLSEFILK